MSVDITLEYGSLLADFSYFFRGKGRMRYCVLPYPHLSMRLSFP